MSAMSAPALMTASITQTREIAIHDGGKCRFCGTSLTDTFVDLGMSPPCNRMIRPNQRNDMEMFYPLHTFVCSNCFLVQIQEYISPAYIFDDYTYFSSYSTSWLEHARRYSTMIVERLGLNSSSHVVEIASNDGYLLQNFVQAGIPCLGVEPAANVAEVALAKGIPSVVKFFGRETATYLLTEGKAADLIIGNNVLAHVPNINDFVSGMKLLLKARGVVTMEFPHLMCLMDQHQFDTIYHEHFSYLSFMTVQRVFASHGLTLFDVEEIPTHGGSLRIYARHSEDSSKPVSARVIDLLTREMEYGLDKIDTYAGFASKCQEVKYALLQFLIDAKRDGKHVVGYGAPGKGNTLLNYCGIREDLLQYTVDRSPYKQNMLLPGTHIPVHTPEKIANTKPDYVLILPWNLKDEIMEQMDYVREWGGRFVVPIPEIKVFS
jgi:2-polyprenyl-3-methyl-5-hydroxy-6-metoxy-1,4-benzoquinol methylase